MNALEPYEEFTKPSQFAEPRGSPPVSPWLSPSSMEGSDENLRRKYNLTQEVIDEALDLEVKHKLWRSVGPIISGQAGSASHQRALDYLKEKKELEEKRKSNSVMWMLVFSPDDGDMHPVEVKLDSGAEFNFITESMVRSLCLRKKSLDKPKEFTSANDTFMCHSKVELEWEGVDKESDITEFFVLPSKSQIERPLVGEPMIEQFRSKLFIENPKSPVAYVAQKKTTPAEITRTEALRQQAAADQAKLSRKRARHEEKRSDKDDNKGSPSKKTKK